MTRENTLELQEVQPRRFRTVIVTLDGIEFMELHREGLSDGDVLRKLDAQRYSRMPGEWMLTIPREHKVFRDPDFKKVIASALSYFWDRDHPEEMDDYFV